MHYSKHIFCCVNVRDPDHPRGCCSVRGSVELRDYMKQRAKELGISGIRVNNAGCLERCELGPAMVIYPEGVWYHYQTREDIEEILQTHVIEDARVARLLLADGQKFPNPINFSRIELEATAIETLTEDTIQIEFRSPDCRDLPPFTAGAHLDLFVGEEQLRRSYSLVNNPSERHRYVVGVLYEPDSRGGSNWLHTQLKVGDTVLAAYPLNNFGLNEEAPEHLLIAGGIGVAPIVSMCYRLCEISAKFTVHYCAKSASEAAFLDTLRKLCGDQLVTHFDGGDPAKGIDLKSVLVDYYEGKQLYLCGPGGLMEDARTFASDWVPESVHSEGFSRVLPANWKNHSFEVVLARRQATLPIAENQTILDALQAEGVKTDYSCEEGLCGACRTTVLHGKVEHRDVVMSENEKNESKSMMICISRAAAGESRLVLDI